MTRDYTESEGSCAWMHVLTEHERERVRGSLHRQNVDAGAMVCHRGEEARYWVGVLDGLVKISSVSVSGKSLTYTGVAPGGWFGEGTLLKSEHWRYDVIALRNSHIGLLPAECFFWLLDRSLEFNRVIVNQLNERLGQFIGQLQIDRLSGADERVARTVAAMFHPILYPGVDRWLRISQEELGYLCGLSRQRVNKALSHLCSLGLLQLRYGGIEVPDLNALRAYESDGAEGEASVLRGLG
ncbi:MAG: Crp/Fnr family transcriptional regulator [Thiomonas arsenitoxydans]|uniref:Crp/Fnr family transcriptional regulator n=2 Tax=Burkholderiales genera incertae sedis TaxID=224471 RepID=A0A8I1SUM1_THIA3|nr:Crp/Fnr family transcriptional regulator [Thiomonas arsenitoxydans]ODU97654.1 MAG: Crp/Fnr family transcriptional regulator [Thiomonas sp. SCN 64-16]